MYEVMLYHDIKIKTNKPHFNNLGLALRIEHVTTLVLKIFSIGSEGSTSTIYKNYNKSMNPYWLHGTLESLCYCNWWVRHLPHLLCSQNSYNHFDREIALPQAFVHVRVQNVISSYS